MISIPSVSYRLAITPLNNKPWEKRTQSRFSKKRKTGGLRTERICNKCGIKTRGIWSIKDEPYCYKCYKYLIKSKLQSQQTKTYINGGRNNRSADKDKTADIQSNNSRKGIPCCIEGCKNEASILRDNFQFCNNCWMKLLYAIKSINPNVNELINMHYVWNGEGEKA